MGVTRQMKIKLATVKKWHDGEVYKFIRGVAVIPNTYFQGKPATITLKEFMEFKKTVDIK